jgi:uncharacterized lipoprotein YmbA
MNQSHPSGIALRMVILLVLGIALGACGSAPTRLFALEPIAPPGPKFQYQGATLRVDAFHVPPAQDRIELVTAATPGQIKIHDTDEWSAPLVEQARQALTADLVARLPPGRVIFPHLAKPPGTLGLTVDVLEFHADGNGASMQASWALAGTTGDPASSGTAGPAGSGAGGGGAVTGGGTVMLRISLPGNTSADTAAAWSQLIAQLADRIVDSLKS